MRSTPVSALERALTTMSFDSAAVMYRGTPRPTSALHVVSERADRRTHRRQAWQREPRVQGWPW